LKGWNVQKINLLSSSLRKLFRNKIFITGFSLYLALILFSIVGSLITPIKLTYVGAAEPLLPPQLHHPLGTDILGRDILALLYAATLNSGKIGLIAAAIGTLIGALIGFISGYYGGSIDFVLRMITDVFLSVPSLLDRKSVV
jgi:ABC-type dipeptide/oligopeptide/nickel transport system permease subunit